MPVKILQKDSPVLREIALNVKVEEINTTKIVKVIQEMKEALDSQEDGVAIAAPQIGYSLRIFVVSRKVEELMEEAKKIKTEKNEEISDAKKSNFKDLVFINPVIKKISKDKKNVEEGCLSVRYLYGKVKRSNKATIVGLDENGKKFERGGTGLLAQIFQHEMDHLDGILFIDKATEVEELPPPKTKSNDRKQN